MNIINFQDYKINKLLENINDCNSKKALDILNQVLATYSEDAAIPIVKICKRFGIKVYQETMPKQIGAKFKITKDLGKIIYVNKTHPKNFQRFAAARELAYYLKNIEEYRQTAEKQAKENIYYINSNYDIYESFATSILLPDFSFCKRFLDTNQYQSWYITEEYLARFFEVPKFTINNKIKQLQK